MGMGEFQPESQIDTGLTGAYTRICCVTQRSHTIYFNLCIEIQDKTTRGTILQKDIVLGKPQPTSRRLRSDLKH